MGKPYVPAWQRLGLKLKNQSSNTSEASPPSASLTAGATPRKRKFKEEVDNAHEAHNSPKKSKRHSAASAGINVTQDSTDTRDHDAQPDSRRKSVTFSPDTKAEDGDSSKRLVQAAYASRLARMTGLAEADIASAGSDLENASTGQNTRQNDLLKEENDKNAVKLNGVSESTAKQHKKNKALPSSKAEKAKQVKKREHAAEYLLEYQNNRASWKFNKSRQITVLKMALDVDSIPAKHDQALKSYLEGLQSNSSRQSLRIEAQEIVAACEADDAALNPVEEARLMRAKLVIDALGSAPAEGSSPGASKLNTVEKADLRLTNGTTNNGINGTSHTMGKAAKANGEARSPGNAAVKKTRRTRSKKRRNVSYSDSSSDSSSSDDGESSG